MSDSAHHHHTANTSTHHHQGHRNEGRVRVVFALTLAAMVVEILAGSWFGSMALLADGWHMGTHAAAFAIALFAYWFARSHADNREFSFGTGKVHYLGGFASAVALAVVALMMMLESIKRVFFPADIHYLEAIVVAVVGLIVNLVSVMILHDDHHHHDHSDHSHHDHNLKAAYFHVLADTLTSLLAIFALLVGAWKNWPSLDALIGIVGGVIIGKWAYGLLQESSAVLLDKQVSRGSATVAVQRLRDEYGIEVVDLRLWKLSEQGVAANLFLASEIGDSRTLKDAVTTIIPNLEHLSIEIH